MIAQTRKPATDLGVSLDRPRRVLLTAAGTGTAFGVIKAARETWGSDVALICADVNPPHLVAASALCDAFVQLPPIADESFGSRLIEALHWQAIDTYFPILDEEHVIAARMRDEGELPTGVLALVPSLESALICSDKLAAFHWLRNCGLPTPLTLPIREASWQADGWIKKPQRGIGSVGVAEIRSESELMTARQDGGATLVQARCRPPECTLDVFISRHSSFERVLCRERLEVKAGVCTKARIFEDDDLNDLALAVGRGLGLTGSFCIQVMRSASTDSWAVTDINPRPGAGTSMSTAVGVNFQAASLADAWGLDARSLLPGIPGEHFVARQYVEYVLSAAPVCV